MDNINVKTQIQSPLGYAWGGIVMGKKKRKPDEQPLFIQFVNSKLERKDVFSLIVKTLNYFPDDEEAACFLALSGCIFEKDEIKTSLINELKSRLDIGIIKDFKTTNKSRIEELRRFCELVSKWQYFDLTKEEENKLLKDFSNLVDRKYSLGLAPMKKITGTIETRRRYYGKKYTELGDMLEFYYSLKFSQLKMKTILEKIVGNIKLDSDLLKTIENFCSDVRTTIFFGGNTYLKKGKSLSMENANLSWGFPYQFLHKIFEPAFYDTLVDFLCTTNWKKLKRCKECGKFFIAKVNRDDIKFCSKECKQANWNKEYTKSGKHAEYMRKKRPEKDKWIT